MKNKNMLKLKKINEERYFRDDRELYRFVLKMRKQTHDEFMNSCKKFDSILHETLIPLNSKSPHRTIKIGDFICQLSEGIFIRKFIYYKYNLLVTGKVTTLTGNDLKKLFNY
jgi:hypothetical protein